MNLAQTSPKISLSRSAYLSLGLDRLKKKAQRTNLSRFTPYQFKPVEYIETYLGWTPWSGVAYDAEGQAEVIEYYLLVLRQLHERMQFQQGGLSKNDLKYWTSGEEIRNYISVDAGHGVGKTKLLAGIVSHFFDCFSPSITYCFAPGFDQINDLLFKEIRTDRRGKNLPGEVLEEPRIKFESNHFVRGRATGNAKGIGSERIQGQHNPYMLFVVDEAEGIEPFVWLAIRSMASGGIAIILIARNPRTTICEAHTLRERSNVKAFTISCLDHPNVRENKPTIAGSVERQYVEGMVQDHAIEVGEHDPDRDTFELPWQPGTIYQPEPEFLWRVLGLTSETTLEDSYCPPGRFRAAVQREEPYDGDDPLTVWYGCDSARFGNDRGKIYRRRLGQVDCIGSFEKARSTAYYRLLKADIKQMLEEGATRFYLRFDAGGGYHSGIVDQLHNDIELTEHKGDFSDIEELQVLEVNFNGTPSNTRRFVDHVTEMYFEAGEACKYLKINNPPSNLMVDLCYRRFRTGHYGGRPDVEILESKDKFKKDHNRSPDDGDGFVLCTAPDRIFRRFRLTVV